MKLSVVCTLFHSEKYCREFYQRMRKTVNELGVPYEFVFVNDGSPDRSKDIILDLMAQDSAISLVDLSRNFGHHQAIMAGLEYSTGDYVFLIDCDLEEDPELLVPFWKKMNEQRALDVVYGIQWKRKGQFFERLSGTFFYKTLNFFTSLEYPSNTLTARLMKKEYVESVLQYKERAIDIWAIFILAGYNQEGIQCEKKHKGSTTYTLSKRISMGVETITSFSHRPLYLIFLVGIIWLAISSVNLAVILVKKWIWGVPLEGWASIMASLWLIGGVIIFLIGIISIYLSKVFLEVKQRPTAIVKHIYRKF